MVKNNSKNTVDFKNNYWHNFMMIIVGIIGSKIAFLAWGLNIFNSCSELFGFLVILIIFVFFIFLLEIFFKGFKIQEFFDGLWIGVVVYCWKPIASLSWAEDWLLAIQNSSFYFIIGFIVLFLGYLYRKSSRRKP
ncbi:MAG: hypothetical protein M0R03_21610 [Novosphingobium sp.]|nr:hypothetical protein [Novosphingobium sp.]